MRRHAKATRAWLTAIARLVEPRLRLGGWHGREFDSPRCLVRQPLARHVDQRHRWHLTPKQQTMSIIACGCVELTASCLYPTWTLAKNTRNTAVSSEIPTKVTVVDLPLHWHTRFTWCHSKIYFLSCSYFANEAKGKAWQQTIPAYLGSCVLVDRLELFTGDRGSGCELSLSLLFHLFSARVISSELVTRRSCDTLSWNSFRPRKNLLLVKNFSSVKTESRSLSRWFDRLLFHRLRATQNCCWCFTPKHVNMASHSTAHSPVYIMAACGASIHSTPCVVECLELQVRYRWVINSVGRGLLAFCLFRGRMQ